MGARGTGYRPLVVAAALVATVLELAAGAAPAVRPTHRPKCPTGAAQLQQLKGCLPTVAMVRNVITPGGDPRPGEHRAIADLVGLRGRVHARGRAGKLLVDTNRMLRLLGNSVVTVDGNGLAPAKWRPSGEPRGAREPISVSDGSGGTATGSGGLIVPSLGELGDGISLKLRDRRTVDGVSVDMGMTLGFTQFADACPNPAGEVAGRVSNISSLSISTVGKAKGGSKAFDGVQVSQGRGTMRARVGPDGKIIDYDLEVDVEISYDGPRSGLFGIAYTAHERIHDHLSLAHLKLGQITTSDFLAAKRSFTGSGFPVLGLAKDDVKWYHDADNNRIALVYAWASSALEHSQHNFYDDAACLKANFTPPALDNVDPSSTHDVALTVTSVRDNGQPVAMPVKLEIGFPGNNGSVTPTSGSSPIQAQLTVSSQPQEITSLDVSGSSKRGRLKGDMKATTGPGQKTYAVTFTGTGTYTEQDTYSTASGTTTYNYTDTFAFNNHFPFVKIPASPATNVSGADVGSLSGSADSNGTDKPTPGNSSSFTCSGSLFDNNAHATGQLQATVSGADASGAYSIGLTGLDHLTADPGQASCNTTGSFFTGISPEVGGQGTRNVKAAMVGTAVVPSNLVGQSSFSLPVRTPAIGQCIPEGSAETCTDSLSWQGNATFTKVGT